jgi:Secretion system C-terminal sorting domain
MKNLISTLTLLIWAISIHAQNCWNTINTISTHPSITTSTNTFDWTQKQTTMYLTKYWNTINQTCTPTTIVLPFWAPNLSVYTNLNLDHYQSLTLPDKDFDPIDGWELLIKEFGEPFPVQATVENPMYALYNRFTGKVRVFMMLTDKSSSLNKNGAYIEMNFSGNSARKTALLQHVEPYANDVQNFNGKLNMNVPNYIDNQDFYWFYADFPTAYDPCTCHLPQDSKILFRLFANTDSKIEGSINGVLQQTVVNNGTPGSSVANSGVMDISALGTGADFAQKTFEFYKSFEGYKNGFDKLGKEIDGWEKQKIDKHLQETFGLNFKLSNNTFIPATFDDMSKNAEGLKELNGTNADPAVLKASKLFAGSIPYVSLVLGLYDFYTASTKPKAPDVKSTPMVFKTDLKLSATMTTVNGISSKIFNTPGSTILASGTGVPIYNNILGVVNILKIPEMEFVEYTAKSPDGDPFNIPNDVFATQQSFIPTIRQYKLSEPFTYALNPASNLELISAEATYILEFGSTDDAVVFGQSPQNKALWLDVDKMPVEFRTPCELSNSSQNIPERMEFQGWETEYLSGKYFDYLTGGGSPKNGIYRIKTPYQSLPCFNTVAFNLYHHSNSSSTSNNECCRNKIPKAILKIIFKMVRKDQKNLKDREVIQQILSFDINEKILNAKKSDLDNGTNKYIFAKELCDNSVFPTFFVQGFENPPIFPTIINSPQELILENITVDRDIFAKRIIIKDGVFLNAGVDLYASEVIETNSTLFQINNSINTLNIGKVYNCNNDPTEAAMKNDGILNICGSSTYSINAVSGKIAKDTSSQNLIATDITLFPNPATDFVNILKPLSSKIKYIQIYDLAGKSLLKIDGDNSKIDIRQLNNGVYIFKIICNDGFIQNNKIVVKRF